MILLGHKRLQYIGEEPLGMAGGLGGTLGAGAPVVLGGKKPDLWAGPTSRRRRPSEPNTQTIFMFDPTPNLKSMEKT
jgi:hypothetical protein